MDKPKPPGKPKRAPVTGLRMNRDIIIKAKHRALDERTTLTRLIEQAIERYLRSSS